MPIQPNDRYRQDAERIRREHADRDGLPVQPPHRGHRSGARTLSWHELNQLPAGSSTRHHLNTH